MSSNAYSASLTPDPWLRIVVLTSARLLIAAGLVLILTMNLGTGVRSVASLVWLGLGYCELRRALRGFDDCIALRIRPGGEIELQNRDGEWLPGELQSGSIVLQRFAWLRVRRSSGALHIELLRGDARSCRDWRRLQVIWRHVGA